MEEKSFIPQTSAIQRCWLLTIVGYHNNNRQHWKRKYYAIMYS